MQTVRSAAINRPRQPFPATTAVLRSIATNRAQPPATAAEAIRFTRSSPQTTAPRPSPPVTAPSKKNRTVLRRTLKIAQQNLPRPPSVAVKELNPPQQVREKRTAATARCPRNNSRGVIKLCSKTGDNWDSKWARSTAMLRHAPKKVDSKLRHSVPKPNPRQIRAPRETTLARQTVSVLMATVPRKAINPRTETGQTKVDTVHHLAVETAAVVDDVAEAAVDVGVN